MDGALAASAAGFAPLTELAVLLAALGLVPAAASTPGPDGPCCERSAEKGRAVAGAIPGGMACPMADSGRARATGISGDATGVRFGSGSRGETGAGCPGSNEAVLGAAVMWHGGTARWLATWSCGLIGPGPTFMAAVCMLRMLGRNCASWPALGATGSIGAII